MMRFILPNFSYLGIQCKLAFSVASDKRWVDIQKVSTLTLTIFSIQMAVVPSYYFFSIVHSEVLCTKIGTAKLWIKQLLLHINSSLNQREDCPHLLTSNIKPGMGMVQCHHLAWSSLLPSGYSDKFGQCKRQAKLCPSEMGAEATKDSSPCLAQEKIQILQKEVELKITLTDVKRC